MSAGEPGTTPTQGNGPPVPPVAPGAPGAPPAGPGHTGSGGGGGAADGPLLVVDDLRVTYGKGAQKFEAVAGVSFTINRGETLGLVGESGCGKSTTGRAIVRLERPSGGSVRFEGTDMAGLSGEQLRRVRIGIQMIFQDPVTSLNPRRRINDVVAEPLDIWELSTGPERARVVREMLELVGLDPDVAGPRRPREFSGGQCQRISIARALVIQPKMLVCDEVVSALDVSVQAQILNLLEDLKARYGLTMLFIAHDLAVVKNISDRVAVMYLGKLAEIAPSDTLYAAPAHHYTAALLASALEPDPTVPAARLPVMGEPPSPINPPSGCRFRTRCPRAETRCAEEVPVMRAIGPGHSVACHFPLVGPEAPPPGSGQEPAASGAPLPL